MNTDEVCNACGINDDGGTLADDENSVVWCDTCWDARGGS